ncbi:MAG: hypothetical protein IPN76_22330 [Saprospiraceae bacterium]|nr:hypothetical protein [Saprospiraceae bacterium]
MAKHQHTEKIEAYLTGQLKPDETVLFEQEMAKDEELAIEVSMRRLEHDAMELLLEKDLKAKLGKWKDNPPPNPYDAPASPPNHGFSWKKWLPFLGLAILVFSGLWYFMQPKEAAVQPNNWPVDTPAAPTTPQPQPNVPVATDEEKGTGTEPQAPATNPKNDKPPVQQNSRYLALANDNYDVADFSSGLKGAGSEKSVFELAAEAFDAKQYAKTIELLAKKEAGNESQVRYLRGHALFNLKRYGQAATEFKAVADNEFAPDFLSAQWYLALSYLAQGPNNSAQFLKLVEELADAKNQHPRQVDAAKLLAGFNAIK